MRSAVAHIRQYKSGQYYQDSFRGERSWNGYERKVLLRNEGLDADGVPRFANVAAAVGADSIADGRGMAFADFDNDGDLDIVMNTNPGDCGKHSVPPVLYRNDLGQTRHWLTVELVGTRSNREAVGAEVKIEAREVPGGRPYRAMRHISVGSGYASQNDHRLLFGLGDTAITSLTLTVRWPSGGEQRFENVASDRWVRVTEGGVPEAVDSRFPSLGRDSLIAAPRPGVGDL